MRVITELSRLKQQAISYIKVGEVAVEGRDLVFYLDNQEVNRFYLPELVRFPTNIYFNRNGITRGGEMILKFSRMYKIVIEEVSGKIRVE
ncbi:MAG: hypothetical protein GY940_17525 [bacterium]|nr:hypothetical protein [bacterium]